ncbi:hypothetical protein [Pseudomonas sp. B15(2017)]|uniref:hypothetical protein n=1 Tax=Pseudomonas sp. B15(2017) TaxID=1981744 RepID=UPI00111BFE71|nr:hypothetical protein [Pseudomonas sp. B15(2017)]
MLFGTSPSIANIVVAGRELGQCDSKLPYCFLSFIVTLYLVGGIKISFISDGTTLFDSAFNHETTKGPANFYSQGRETTAKANYNWSGGTSSFSSYTKRYPLYLGRRQLGRQSSRRVKSFGDWV